MHIPTHLMSGWCIGNLFPITGKERVMCMVAAAISDLDGLSILGGVDAYQKYHHEVCHNLPFGFIACAVLSLISGRRLLAFILYLGLFHLHLVMDFFGSGPGWPIYYLWPFSHWSPNNWQWGWELFSWQNITTAGVLLAWTIIIAAYAGRTPLEVLMPNLDGQLVELAQRVFGKAKKVQAKGIT